MKADVPKDVTGVALSVGDRVCNDFKSWEKGTVTFVYPDSAGVIDCRVRFDGYTEERAIHGSCMRKLRPCHTCGKLGHMPQDHAGWDPRD